MVDLAPVKAVSNEEAETADFVVCCRTGGPRIFTDDVETICCDCGHGIFHRPHVPQRPPKICLECVLDREKGGRA